jgi:hypothetical protein
MTATTGDGYQGTIPGAAVKASAVEYYVEAIDDSAGANVSRWPAAAPAQPATFTVKPPADQTGPDVNVTQVADGRPQGHDVTVEVVATDPSGIDTVTLHYRGQGAADFVTLTMAAGAAADQYTAVIPAAAVLPPAVEFWVEATDGAGNATKAPADAPTGVYDFTVEATAPDLFGPVIAHDPLAGPLPAGSAITVTAQIEDESGVADARVFYRPAGGTWASAALALADGTTYTTTVPASAVVAGEFEYYIEATDGSAAANVSRAPSGGADAPYALTITGVEPPAGGGGCRSGVDGAGLAGAMLAAMLAVMAIRRRRA